jgi:PilZ domain
MPASERRRTRRFKVSIPLRVHATAEHDDRVQSINVSASGVCFATSQALRVGQRVELELRIPKRVTGSKPAERCFTGRVVHIKTNGSSGTPLEVGVQFLYYESGRNSHSRSNHHSHPGIKLLF